MSGVDQEIKRNSETFGKDVEIAHKMVHGTEQESVQTDNGLVPSYNKRAADALRPVVGSINEHAELVIAAKDEAAQSAAEAKAQVANVNTAGGEQIKAIEAAGQQATTDVQAEATKQVQAVTTAGTTQTGAVNTAGASQIKAITDLSEEEQAKLDKAGSDQADFVNAAGVAQVSAINSAGTSQLQNIVQEGGTQTNRVTKAGDTAVGVVNEYVERAEGHASTAQQAANTSQGIADKFGDIDEAVSQTAANAATATTKAGEASNSAARADAAAERAGEIAGLEDVRDALRLAVVSRPDFHLPLINDLTIREGKGTPYQIDVSPTQDGSVMVDLPIYKADFSRASKATYINKYGVLVDAGINEPREEKEGLLCEGVSTNIVEYSEGPYWYTPYSRYTITRLTDHTTPFGSGGNVLLYVSDTTSGGARLTYLQVANSPSSAALAGKTVTASLWFHKSNPVKGLTIGGAGFDTTIGSKTPIAVCGEWERYAVTVTLPDIPDHNANIYPSGTIEAGAEAKYFGFQVEELPFASSYIPTNGTPVTRVPDVPKFYGCSDWGVTPDKTLSFKFTCMGFHGWNNAINLGGQQIIIYWPNLRLRVESGGHPTTYITNNPVKIGGEVNRVSIVNTGDTLRTAMNGETTTTQGKIFGTASDSMGGSYSRPLWGHLREVKIWTKALTPEQIANI